MEQTVYDQMLGKEVPKMVYIRNKQIQDEYLNGEILDQEKQRRLVLLQSQLNLQLH